MMVAPDGRLPIHDELAGACPPGSLAPKLADRFAFHDDASTAVAMIRSGELRPYGNILIYKGFVTL
jgi:L-fucose mutarotase